MTSLPYSVWKSWELTIVHHTYNMPWQKRFTLPPHTKGMHLVTDAVLRECQEGLRNVDIGIFTLNCLHTSAGLTVSLAR
jgi:thiamine phosphate synthase YjbQ (UPF0047 family)